MIKNCNLFQQKEPVMISHLALADDPYKQSLFATLPHTLVALYPLGTACIVHFVPQTIRQRSNHTCQTLPLCRDNPLLLKMKVNLLLIFDLQNLHIIWSHCNEAITRVVLIQHRAMSNFSTNMMSQSSDTPRRSS